MCDVVLICEKKTTCHKDLDQENNKTAQTTRVDNDTTNQPTQFDLNKCLNDENKNTSAIAKFI